MKKIFKLTALLLALLTLAALVSSCGYSTPQNDNHLSTDISGNSGSSATPGEIKDLDPAALYAALRRYSYVLNAHIVEDGNIRNRTVTKFSENFRISESMDEYFYFDGNNSRLIVKEDDRWYYSYEKAYSHDTILFDTFSVESDFLFKTENYSYDESSDTYRMKQSAIEDYVDGMENVAAFISIAEGYNCYTVTITANYEGSVTEISAEIRFDQDPFTIPFAIPYEDKDDPDNGYIDDGDDYESIFLNDEIIYNDRYGIRLRMLKNGNYCLVSIYDDREELIIPSDVDGIKITEIGRYAIEYTGMVRKVVLPLSITTIHERAITSGNIESINLPVGVTSLGNACFQNLGIKSITIPETVTDIPQNAFAYCYNLESVTLHDKIESIGSYAFLNCNELKEFTVPASVTEFGVTPFGKCRFDSFTCLSPSAVNREGIWYDTEFTKVVYADKSITSVCIPATVKNISFAFAYCEKLTKVTFEDGGSIALTKIGESAFDQCFSLNEIKIPEGITEIGCQAFYNTDLTSLYVPSGVKLIGEYAFSDNRNLQKLVLNEGLEEVGYMAFYNCGMPSVYIPSTLTSMGTCIFADCSNLNTIEVNSNNPIYFETQGCIIDSRNGALYFSSTGDIPKDDRVTAITAYALSKLDGLCTIWIPSNINTIYSNAFWGVYRVSVMVPDTVTHISSGAFDGSYHFVYTEAFHQPVNWENDWIYDPGNYKNIVTWGYDVSAGTPPKGELQFQMDYDDEGSYYYVSGLGNWTDPDLIVPGSYKGLPVRSTNGCLGGVFFRSVTFGEGFRSINSYEIYDQNLVEVNIPSTVSYISSAAFGHNDKLTKINVSPENPYYTSIECGIVEKDRKTLIMGNANTVIPSDGSVTEIGYCAFQNAKGLKRVVIPDGVVRIGHYAFSNCSELETVYISRTVSSIESSGFGGSNSITEFNVDPANKIFRGVGGMLIHIESSTLLKGTTPDAIPSYIKIIGGDSFRDLVGCKNIIIPEGVEHIEYDAFRNSDAISVHLPSTIKDFTPSAFNCTEIESISISPSNTVYYAVNNCLIEKATGKIVYGTKNAVIPGDRSITTIDNFAFYYTILEGELVIPSNITTIRYNAFWGTALNVIYIPASVKVIEEDAFYNYDTDKLVIMCEAESMPDTWHKSWCHYDTKVSWGCEMP